MRFAKTYFYDFSAHAKGRWVGRTLCDVLLKEFRYYTREYVEDAMKDGRITINNKPCKTNQLVKRNDVFTHKIHRHEVPVVDCGTFEFLAHTENYLIVNKPASIPAHPCGRYRKNSMSMILELEYGFKNLFLIHRLDRMTSGVMMFAKNKEYAKEVQEHIRTQTDIMKIYLARAKGKLEPLGYVIDILTLSSERMVVDMPIDCRDFRKGIWEAFPEGKYPSKTVMYPVQYHAESDTTLVICRPITGRTHQIRVHLRYVKTPIANDVCYGPQVLDLSKSISEEAEEYDDTFVPQYDNDDAATTTTDNTANTIVTPTIAPTTTTTTTTTTSSDSTEASNPNKRIASDALGPSEQEPAAKRPKLTPVDPTNFLPYCRECFIPYRKVTPQDLTMWLHAFIYEGPDFRYQTAIPEWCNEFDKELLLKVLAKCELFEKTANESVQIDLGENPRVTRKKLNQMEKRKAKKELREALSKQDDDEIAAASTTTTTTTTTTMDNNNQ